jgi:hypothetical protein
MRTLLEEALERRVACTQRKIDRMGEECLLPKEGTPALEECRQETRDFTTPRETGEESLDVRTEGERTPSREAGKGAKEALEVCNKALWSEGRRSHVRDGRHLNGGDKLWTWLLARGIREDPCWLKGHEDLPLRHRLYVRQALECLRERNEVVPEGVREETDSADVGTPEGEGAS